MSKPTDRRVYTEEFKRGVAEEVLSGRSTQGEQCIKHNIASSVVSAWVKRAKAGKAAKGKRNASHFIPKATPEQKTAAIAELDAGGNANEIAKRLNVSPAALYWWRKRGYVGKPAANGKPGGYVGKPVETQAVVVVPTAVNGKANGNGRHVTTLPPEVRDATVFLRKAKSELLAGLRSGAIDDLDSSHLLSLLALNSLQGG